jgi:hypothetical protein
MSLFIVPRKANGPRGPRTLRCPFRDCKRRCADYLRAAPVGADGLADRARVDLKLAQLAIDQPQGRRYRNAVDRREPNAQRID